MNTGIFIVGFILFSLYIFGLLYMINYSHRSQEEELNKDPELKDKNI